MGMHLLDEKLLLFLVLVETLQEEFLSNDVLFQFVHELLLETCTWCTAPLVCVLKKSLVHPPRALRLSLVGEGVAVGVR
jgi:hypothetical protein